MSDAAGIASVVRCPVCDGQGLVSRPPWLSGDVREWTDTTTAPYECRACGGKGFVVIPPASFGGRTGGR